jgi:pSer/pThr/pTyr-binding forkhead associated (FHA) protein
MPSLLIHFPEKETPTTLVLKGARITVGRRANNTIQILDRTLSASHAEFIAEPDGHYRLHDLGSTNGTQVNGEAVCDYQLEETCKISFGAVECDFNPETPAQTADGEVEVLPTRAEMAALHEVNIELRKNIEALREQIGIFTKTVSASADDSVASSLSAELQQAVLERGELKETTQRQTREFEHLRAELAVIKRDRLNLENALRDARVENERLKKTATDAPTGKAESAPTASSFSARPAPVAQEPAKPAWPKVTAPLAKPPPPAPKPPLPPPSAPSLVPVKSPASTGAPTARPIPKFATTAPPGT